MALVLNRKTGESVAIETPSGERIVVTVVESQHGRTRLAFDAPRSVTIMRTELVARTKGDPMEPMD